MPSVTIPLVGPINNRRQLQSDGATGASGDQRFINCDFDVVKNPVTGDGKFYVQKRPSTDLYLSSNSTAGGAASYGFFVSVTGNIISSFGTSGQIYINDTHLGTMTGIRPLHITEASISGKQYYFLTCTSGQGFYIVSDSYAQTSYTGDRTSGSAIISNIASTAGMYVGQGISGTGIASGSRILTVDSSSQITLTIAATSGAATSTTLTKEPFAKFISSNFPADIVGKFVYMDGFLFIMDATNKRIYQSALNDITTWAASDYITVQSSGEAAAGIVRSGSMIVALLQASMEFFRNVGNPTGSVISTEKELFRRVGCEAGLDVYGDSVPYCVSGDNIFLLGNEGNQSRGVYVLRGAEARKISTPEVDLQISRTASGVTWIISTFNMAGKTYVCVSETASPYRKYVGCLETRIWSEYQMGSNAYVVFAGGKVNITGGYTVDPSAAFCVFRNSSQIPSVYRLRGDIYQDEDGGSNILKAQTSKTDFETDNIKTIKSVALMGSDIQSTGTATLEYSDDDYTTWTTAGTFDLTKINPRIHRCGSFRGGRAWRITHSANTPFRAQALKFEYEIGSH